MEINDRKLPLRIDFISEFYYKNCQHIIDNILGELCPMTILRASTVCQTWKIILKQSSKFPHDIAQLFNRYKGTIQPGLRLVPSGNFFLALK